ncbi:hypothetical protein HJG60_001849 [Phyllostomus discolor]|uniref:NELL2-interacting cell ontogeny regulator 1 n=1 Tax=Phyllostomus discolor TaxID=89673 RepID=A0A834BF71_9CHIR|nr:hypothetical protein HJG60_001849 [Phyllostomus discolor]
MAPPSLCRPPRPWLPLLLLLLLNVTLLGAPARAEPATGSSIPAQSRPCVDCHAFEFMQRALQDLRKTAYSLDTRVRGRQGPRVCVPQSPRPAAGAAPSSGPDYPGHSGRWSHLGGSTSSGAQHTGCSPSVGGCGLSSSPPKASLGTFPWLPPKARP